MAEDHTDDSRASYFTGVERKHRRRVLLWGGLGMTVAAAVFAYALLRMPSQDGSGTRRPPAGNRSSEATTSAEATSSATPTSTPGTPGTPPAGQGGTGGSGGAGGGETPKPAPNAGGRGVAYRIGTDVWVAREDGSGARKIAGGVDAMQYALSPDAATLAVGRASGLELITVSTGATRRASKSSVTGISWSPDSTRLAFASESAARAADWTVTIANADGSAARPLGPGSNPRFSPDGSHVAYADASSAGGGIAVAASAAGKPKVLAGTPGSLDFAWASADALFVAQPQDADTSGMPRMAMLRVTLAGSSSVVYSASLKEPVVTWRYLYVSGGALAFAGLGDDGYSRAFVLSAGKLAGLTVRRDTCPIGWTSQGKVLFIEGNAFQGESTSLMSANADGTGRAVVAPEATR